MCPKRRGNLAMLSIVDAIAVGEGMIPRTKAQSFQH